jgi:hypothetical protein
MKKFKRLTSFIFIFILSFSGLINVNAYENTNGLKKGVEIHAMSGYIFDDYIDYRNSSNVDVSMTEVNIDLNDISLSGNLNYEGNIYPIYLDGVVYPFDDGIYKDNLILGEFISNNNRFKVINFKCYGTTKNDKLIYKNKGMVNNSTISLALEDLTTNKVIYLQCQVDKAVFQKLLTVANQYLSSLNLSKENKINKLMDLYKLNKSSSLNVDTSESNEKIVEGPTVYDSNDGFATTYGAPALSYSTLKRFIDDLNNYGTVTLSNYGIPASFFTTTGWGHYHSASPNVFSYSNYSTTNGAYNYLSQFSLLQGVANNSVSGNIVSYGLQLNLYGGMIVEYDSYTGTVDVLFYGVPLTHSNVQLGISKLAGNYNNFFIERDVNGVMNTTNYNAIKGLIALTLSNTFMSTFWDFASIEIQTNAIYGNKSIFRDTVDGQITYYDGLIRGIYADSSSAYMNIPGHYFLLDGKFKFTSTWSVEWNYKYVAKHNL